MQKRRNENLGRMAVELDISKAYDRIKWKYLQVVLKRLGFHDQWIDLVMSYITLVTYSMFVNERPGTTIIPTRGLRQGDPLSPNIFLLCAKGLNSMLNQTKNRRELHGAKFIRGGISTNHLLFADDCVLFCKLPLNNGLHCEISC